MSRQSVRAFALVGALAMAAPAAAQTPAALAAATAPDGVKLDLARRYIAAAHMDRMMGPMLRSVAAALSENLAKSNPNLMAQARSAMADAVSESGAAMMVRLADRMAPLLAETFTEKELRDVVAFYESPTGQSVTAKMPTLMAKLAPTMVELMPQMQADIHQRLCAKIDCSKLGPPNS